MIMKNEYINKWIVLQGMLKELQVGCNIFINFYCCNITVLVFLYFFRRVIYVLRQMHTHAILFTFTICCSNFLQFFEF